MADFDFNKTDFSASGPTGFFAYPANPPSIPHTIKAAISSINKVQHAEIITWEDLKINGLYIIGEICQAIERSDFFCADVTTINANVMFEIGFAIAEGRRIWLLRDSSYSDPKKDFDQLRMLTTIGYTGYVNSEDTDSREGNLTPSDCALNRRPADIPIRFNTPGSNLPRPVGSVKRPGLPVRKRRDESRRCRRGASAPRSAPAGCVP